MTFETASHAWNNLCFKSIGVDANGDEVSELTKFGAFVLGADAPLSITKFTKSKELHKAKNILRAWSDAIELYAYRKSQEESK